MRAAQYARAWAAVVVVVFHASVGARIAFGGDLDQWFRSGVAGVDVFFVLSGFIMRVSLGARELPGGGEFFRRRLWRIVPLYWIATLCLAVLYLDRLIVAVPKAPFYYIGSFLFIPWETPGHPGEIFPLLSVGWTLNYEMFFYLVIALCLGVGRLWMVPVVLGLLVVAGMVFRPEGAVLVSWTSPLMLEFVAGLAVGQLYLLGVRIARGWLVAAVVLAVAVIPMTTEAALGSHGARVLVWGIPAMMLVGTMVLGRGGVWGNRGALLLGDASYAIYLFHPIVITLFQMGIVAWLGPREMIGGAAVFLCIAVFLGCGVGIGVHLMVERPMSRVLRGDRRVCAPA